MDQVLNLLSGFVSSETISVVTNVLAVLGGAAFAAANIPRKEGSSSKWYWKVIDFVAQNYNQAKNTK
jgi:hypothetical protein